MDVTTLDKFISAMVNGVNAENFPVLVADVYNEVIRDPGQDRNDIVLRCGQIISYIIDSTTVSSESDVELFLQMVPAMVAAFMNVGRPRRRCCF